MDEDPTRRFVPEARISPAEARPRAGNAEPFRFRVGDHVTWHAQDGEARGTIVHFATEPGEVEGRRYDASEDAPRYVVMREGSGRHEALRAHELLPE